MAQQVKPLLETPASHKCISLRSAALLLTQVLIIVGGKMAQNGPSVCATKLTKETWRKHLTLGFCLAKVSPFIEFSREWISR